MEAARIHGSAQVADQTSCRKRCQIYSADSSGSGRGRLVTVDVDAEEDMEVVMEEAAEVVVGVIEIALEYLISTELISPTAFAHLPTKNGPRSVQAVGEPMSLRNVS